MASEPLAPATVPTRAAPSTTLVAASIFGASAVLCVAGYLALTASGPWFGGPPERYWSAEALKATRGSARLGEEGLLVLAPDSTGTVVVSLNANAALRASAYPVIAWDVLNVPEGVEATLLWYSDYKASRISTRALAIEGRRIAAADLARDRNWIGTIGGLALVLRGSLREPILVRGVSAKPMTPGQIAADRGSEWLTYEPWNGASINTITGGADAQDLPLPVLLAAIVVAGALFYATSARWAPGLVGTFRPAVIAVGFLAAWLVLDARWQWNLLRQGGSTIEQYAGKDWRQRHLAAEDGRLFAFIEDVRAKLPPPVEGTPRVFVVADAHYFRDRGAYHLYPYNVYFDPLRDTIPPASTLQAGDYLVAYGREGLQYDAARERLRWDANESVAAERLLGGPSEALYRIR
jgi:hypothetical protein